MSVRPAGVRDTAGWRWSRLRVSCVILAVGLSLVLLAFAVLRDRREQLARAQVLAAGHINALGNHVASLADGLELALDKVEQKIQGRPAAEIRADADLYRLLSALQAKFSLSESVFAVDADGRTLASSRAFPVPPYDVRDREYFTAAKAGHEGLYVSQPYRAQMARDVSFVLSRPMVRDGRFAGVLAVTISPAALQAFYGGVIGPSGAGAVLARADGVVLMRTLTGPKWPDRLPELSDLMKSAGEREAGLLVGTSLVAGERVLYAFRALRDRKLIVVLAIREADMLAPWYRRSLLYGGGVAATALGLLVWALPWRAPAVPTTASRPLCSAPGPMSGDAHEEGGGRRLSSSAQRVLKALADAVRGRLAARDPTGADHAAALVQALLRFAADEAPQPTQIRIFDVLFALPPLLASAGGPTVRLPDGEDARTVQVFADPAQLSLALVDCALSLAATDPPARIQDLRAQVRTVAVGEVDGLVAGSYVCVSLTAAGPQAANGAPAFPTGAAREASSVCGLAANYAPGLWGVAVTISGSEGRPPAVQFWLPEAVAAHEAKPALV